jgi:sugar lactone lactonase YvrE
VKSVRKAVYFGITVLGILLLSTSLSLVVSAFQNGGNASLVIGQTDFSGLQNHAGTPGGLATPTAVAIDASGNLWVADSSNSRILEFKAPLTTGESASVVLGQTSLTAVGECLGTGSLGETCDPEGLAFDSSGNLWVADASRNNWVVEFKAPFANGESASLMLGGAPFSGGMNDTSLAQPRGLSFDSTGNLWVADTGDSRLLRFNAPFTNHEAASLVLGASDFNSSIQVSFDSYLQNKSAIPGPTVIAIDKSGNVWVTNVFDLVTMFPPPFSLGETPSIIVGDLSLAANPTSANSTTMNSPNGIAFDSSGNLWVSDTSYDRILEFTTPITTREAASVVLGHNNFQTIFPALDNNSAIIATQSDLRSPDGIAFDSSGNLWVSDQGFSRVMEFSTSGAQAATNSSSAASSLTSTATSILLTSRTTTSFSTTGAISTTSSAGATTSSAVAPPPTSTTTTQSSSSTSISSNYVLVLAVAGIVIVSTITASRRRIRKS